MNTLQNKFELLFKRNLLLPGWGELALGSLQWALISGLLLIPAFNPANAFVSVSKLISAGAFGHFLHSFHSYSGDLFLIATLIHLVEYLYKRTYKTYRFNSWFFLVLLSIVSILVVFTGFLSIGSMESSSARAIFESVSRTVTGIGEYIVLFFAGPLSDNKVTTFLYIHHAATLTILTIILTYIHLRRMRSERYVLIYSLFVLSLAALVFPVVIGTPQDAVVTVVKGPWYFVGLQEMLSWMPVFMAGILFPIIVVVIFSILPVLQKLERPVLYLLIVLMIFYFFESIIGAFFRGGGWQIFSN